MLQKQTSTEERGKTERVDLEVFLVEAPDRTPEEAIKLFMPHGKNSLRWQDYNTAADRAMTANDYSAAEYLLSCSIKLNPGVAKSYYLRGRSRYDSLDNKNDEAIVDIEKAINMGVESPGAFEILASIYDAKGDQKKAIEVLTRGIGRCVKKKHLYHTRATLYVALEEYEKALKDYGSLLERSPSARVFIMRGQLHEKLGNKSRALEDYESASTIEVTDDVLNTKVMSLKLRAALLSRLDRHEESVEDLCKALAVRKGDDELLRLRGEQYNALGEYDRAIADFTDSINASPKYARLAYEARGKAYKMIGKQELARRDLQTAAQMKEAPAEKTLYKMKRE